MNKSKQMMTVTIRLLLTWLFSLLAALQLQSSYAAEVITYYHNDISGSPILSTNVSGNVIWKESYRPYGDKLTKSTASGTNQIGFHGKPFDDESGLSYMQARYYDPVIGRFMGIDPVAYQEDNLHSFNRYAYANNNPYKYVDPDGEIPVLVIPVGIAVGRVVGIVGRAVYLNAPRIGAFVEGLSPAAAGSVGVGALAGTAAKGATANRVSVQASGGLTKSTAQTANKQLTKSGDKTIRSYEKLIAEHKQKLADYKENPLKYDNQGTYKNAPNDSIRQSIYNGRIKALEKQIYKQENELKKAIENPNNYLR